MTITLTGTQASIRAMYDHGIRLNAFVNLDGNVDQYEVHSPSGYSLHYDRGLALVAYADACEAVAARTSNRHEADRLSDEAARAILSAFGA
ncbi:hypothetical protein EXE59_09780 [Nocardioides eburneiflavus]|uniref:Uncharacterized protein n=1 Tax=Nocardioides eburneiflavus TaxID=2518372 RepID=A0A4Z1CFB3_9ACTN|nr:hypothetical protein [Nocardioides eburneiflavus]TGN64208.1 hypothetical protein EXE59_09780 [Nocardioides eburneiflavus]